MCCATDAAPSHCDHSTAISHSDVKDYREGVDAEAIRGAVRQILIAVGKDPDRPGLIETPRRVAKMYEEMFSGLKTDPARHLRLHVDPRHSETGQQNGHECIAWYL